jgi:hypothetical protein
MNNKEFREDQLEKAGWIKRTPQSGYWHRRDVSFYFSADEAYEQECRFPEQVRLMFIAQGVKDFGRRELNDDVMNAAICEAGRKAFNDVLNRMSPGTIVSPLTDHGKDFASKILSADLSKQRAQEVSPSKILIPSMPQNIYDCGLHRIKETQEPKPRYKVTTNGANDFVVDCESGRSIWLTKCNGRSYNQALKVCKVLNESLDKASNS